MATAPTAEPKVATVKLGGVTLATTSWQWPLAVGGSSPEVAFYVNNVVDAQLAALENPVTLEAEVERGDGVKSNPVVTNLYLLARYRTSAFEVRWFLGDQRRLFRDVLVGGRFNATRRANDFAQANTPDALGLLSQLDQIRKFRYLPGTLKDSSDPPDFFTPSGEELTENTGTLWTALDIVKWILGRATKGRPGLPEIKFKVEVADNGYVHEDVYLGVVGESFPSVLDRFLNLARAYVYVDEDGTWIVGDVAAAPIPHRVGGYEGAGHVEKEDISRERPATVAVRFGVESEMLIEFEEGRTAARGIDHQRVRNVAVIPQDVTVKGVKYARGQYVPIEDAILIANARGWPTGKELSVPMLRRLYLSRDALMDKLCSRQGQLPNYDTEALEWLSTIVVAYRTYYQLSGPLMDAISSWAPVRIGVIDPLTGHRQPSPVWSDHCVVPSGKRKVKKSDANSANHATNVDHPDGPAQLKTAAISSAKIVVVDHDLGIFAVSWNTPDVTGRVHTLLPSRVDNPMLMTVENIGSAGMRELNSLQTVHRMSAIISVRWALPNGVASHYTLHAKAADFTDAKALGPPYEVRHHNEPARYMWIPGETELQTDQGIRLDKAKIVNSAIVHAVARAEAMRVYWSFADRWVGMYRRARYEKGVDRPRGSVRSVAIRFVEGTLECVYDLPAGAPPPDPYTLMPGPVRKYIYRQLDKVGS